MKLYFHYCASGLSNCYVLGTYPPKNEAIIVDPGSMDLDLLKIIEDNNFNVLAILITHDHLDHTGGLTTIMKIYESKVYAVAPEIRGLAAIRIRDGDSIAAGPFNIEVFSVPGHSADSVIFKIDRLLFTGDTLNANLIGSTVSSFSKATLVSALRKKILSLPGDYTILPGHGPPSTLEAERRFNFDLNNFEQMKSRRPSFRIDL